VWQAVCALLAHPERLTEEYQRRVHADRQPKHTTLTGLAAQLGKRRQGLARWIDSDTAGLIDKPEFEPRLSRLRQRIAHLEAQRQQLAEEAALHADLHLMAVGGRCGAGPGRAGRGQVDPETGVDPRVGQARGGGP
jgi:site-specific DNA recombinase